MGIGVGRSGGRFGRWGGGGSVRGEEKDRWGEGVYKEEGKGRS